MRPDEIVVGGVYRAKPAKMAVRVTAIYPNDIVDYETIVEQGREELKWFARWAGERIDGEGK